MERLVETALGSAGDFAGAAAWRRTCRDLLTGARIGVVGLAAEATTRLARRLQQPLPHATWIPLVLDAPEDEDGDPVAPAIGAEDALLATHTLLWATSITAPLGARERRTLAGLDRVAPSRRAVVLTDLDLMGRISDDPEAEALLVRERLAAMAPEGWEILDERSVVAWLRELSDDLPRVTRARRREVARTLLCDARERTEVALETSVEAVEQCEALLAAEDDTLEQARKQGERVAAHLLASMRRRTETLLVDLRTFLHELERDLPLQIDTLDDPRTVRRVLPHWLDHVVEQWMTRNLADWRAGVFIDIAEVRIEQEEAERAELLPPLLHPAPLRNPSEWGRRLAVTAALGSGALLAVVGLWIPGAFVASGGLAYGAWSQLDGGDASRDQLVESSRAAVRRLAADAERRIGEQLTQIEGELGTLGDARARDLEETRADTRAELVQQRAHHRARSRELRQIREVLAVRLEAIAAESP